jgi:hypothetical protein
VDVVDGHQVDRDSAVRADAAVIEGLAGHWADVVGEVVVMVDSQFLSAAVRVCHLLLDRLLLAVAARRMETLLLMMLLALKYTPPEVMALG